MGWSGTSSRTLMATAGPVLVVDTGASWLDLFAEHPPPVVVLDHHQYPGAPNPPPLPDHVAFVNPLDWGVDGMSEMCASTLTWLFTVFLDPVNWDNAPWGLSGAIADRQHVGGFRGLNARLVDEAIRRSLIVRRRASPSSARPSGRRSRAASTRSSAASRAGPRPSGRSCAASDRPGPASRGPHRGGEPPPGRDPQRTARGARGAPRVRDVLDQERWFVPSLGLDAEELSNLQNAAGRAGIPGVGVAFALGDPRSAERARTAESEWRTGILRGLRRVEEGGVHSMRSLRWFESPETTLAGTQAGLAMNYLLPPDHPVFVFSDAVRVRSRSAPAGPSARSSGGSTSRRPAASRPPRSEGRAGATGSRAARRSRAGPRPAFLEAANRDVAEQLGPTGGTPLSTPPAAVPDPRSTGSTTTRSSRRCTAPTSITR